MNFKKYFRELNRRHVVKAGIAYLVVAWLLIQVLTRPKIAIQVIK
jgi:hypothetical protein